MFTEKQADDDVELTEFDDEIEAWIIAEFKKSRFRNCEKCIR